MTLPRLLFYSFSLFSALLAAHAQTIISGNVSGTWTPAGNPYNVVSDTTVTPGTNLTIQPGCHVVIGSGVTLIASNSLIQAVGTANQRIAFEFATTNNCYILVQNPPGNPPGTNRFKFCDFTNGTTGIGIQQFGGQKSIYVEVMNCTFTNCAHQGVYAEAQGLTVNSAQWAQVNPIIKNSVFDHTGNGCTLYIDSDTSCCSSPGYASPIISGNIFRNMTNATSIYGRGILLTNYFVAGASSPLIANNIFVNCRIGIDARDPWDVVAQNNIFVGSSNAVIDLGSLSRMISYNDFFGNATNFTGYPGSYGTPSTLNRNGTACDLLSNIFQNPLFTSSTDYHLSLSSLCIDAGEGSPTNYDHCFPPSLGTNTNDMGAYGGPDACNWLGAVPVPYTVSIAKYVAVSFNPPTNASYRLEYSNALGGTSWATLTNVNLTAPFTYYDPVAPGQRFYRAVFLP